MMVMVRSLESVSFSRYFCFCNVLCICNIRAILTYRVYWLYDIYINFTQVLHYLSCKHVSYRYCHHLSGASKAIVVYPWMFLKFMSSTPFWHIATPNVCIGIRNQVTDVNSTHHLHYSWYMNKWRWWSHLDVNIKYTCGMYASKGSG